MLSKCCCVRLEHPYRPDKATISQSIALVWAVTVYLANQRLVVFEKPVCKQTLLQFHLVHTSGNEITQVLLMLYSIFCLLGLIYTSALSVRRSYSVGCV